MSVSRLFSIIGDSNVRRNMTSLNIASREVMKRSQIIDCASLASLESSLREVNADAEVLIVAMITEALISGGDCGTIASSIDPILAAFTAKINAFCSFRPDLQVRLVFA